MRAKQTILTLVFLLAFSASAFGAWTTQETTTLTLNAIDGLVTTNLTTLCAVGNNGTVEVSNDYGATWSNPITDATIGTTTLKGVSIKSNNIWTVGESAGVVKIFHSSDWGANWTTQFSDSGNFTLADISFGSASKGVATGTNFITGGIIYYTSSGGSSWSSQQLVPGTIELYKVHALDANTFWVVGKSGEVHKSIDGGVAWTTQESGTSENLYDVHFIDANNGFIVGNNGTFLKTTDGGASWESTGDLPSDETFRGVYFTDTSNGWAVGYEVDISFNLIGKIYKTTNGGTNWTSEYSDTAISTPIYGVYFTDINNGWAVGQGGSGRILSNITPVALTSVVQAARLTQHQAPQGFSGNLTLTGTNFQAGSWGPSNVAFTGTGITVNSVARNSSTQLTANVTISTEATASLRGAMVTNIDGSFDTLTNAFRVTAPPLITGLSPASATQGATADVTLHGNYFQNGITTSDVSFDSGISITNVTFVSTFEIEVEIDIDANAPTGLHNVYVTNPDGGVSNAFGFTVLSASPLVINPTISSIDPINVTVGATSKNIDIDGTDFDSGIVASFESNGIIINFLTYTSSTEITMNIDVLSTAPTGPRAIIVRNPDGGAGSSADNDVYLYVQSVGVVNPTIEAVDEPVLFRGDPNRFISGQGFQDGALVSILPSDDIDILNVEFVDSNSIRITAAVGVSADLGFRAIKLINPDGGWAILFNAIEIRDQAPEGQAKIVNKRVLVYPNPSNVLKNTIALQLELTGPAKVKFFAIDFAGQYLLEAIREETGVAGINTFYIKPEEWNEFSLGTGIILVPFLVEGNIAYGKIVHLGGNIDQW